MTRERERQCINLLTGHLGARIGATPDWLVRPGKAECGARWHLTKEIYAELTGMELPDLMRPVERRTVDAVLMVDGQPPRIFEFDENQHFNRYRAMTLRRYPTGTEVAFPVEDWIEVSDRKSRLEGGGFGRPMPPLFPHEDGRHRQRAFRDALCDLLPLEHGFGPTLRIGLFEVAGWLDSPDAADRMANLVSRRLGRRRPGLE